MIRESRNPMVKTARAARVWGIVLLCSVGHVCLRASSTFADTAASKAELGPWAQGLRVRPGMDASGRILKGCTFVGLDLTRARFDGADLNGCKIYQCDLRNTSFKNAILSGLQWGQCELEGAAFDDAVINGVQPIRSVSGNGIQFTAAQFVSTRNYKTKNLSNCIVAIALANGKIVPHKLDFRNADLRNTIFVSCDLRQCDFTGATIDGMAMNGGTILFAQLAATKNYAKGNLFRTGFGGVTTPDSWKLTGLDLTGHGSTARDCSTMPIFVTPSSVVAPSAARSIRRSYPPHGVIE